MIEKEENDKMKSNRNRVETSLDNPVETGFESYAENVAGHRLKELLLKERASVTLEAAIILPIFCFLFMALNGVFFVFSAQNQVMHALVQTANSLSLDPYWNEKTGVENPNVSNMLQNFERSITQDKSFILLQKAGTRMKQCLPACWKTDFILILPGMEINSVLILN